MFWKLTLSDTWFANTFSDFLGWLFTLLPLPFDMQKLLNVLFVSYPWNCQDQCYEAFLLCLFSKILIVEGLRFNYSIPFVLIFVYIGKCFQIHYLVCGYIIFPTSFVEEIIFSQLCIFQTFVWEWLTDLFLGLCFNPLVYVCVFMPVSYCIKHCSFATHILN